MHLFQLQEAATTCVHFVLFLLQEEEKEVEIQKVFLEKLMSLTKKDIRRLPYLDKMSIATCGTEEAPKKILKRQVRSRKKILKGSQTCLKWLPQIFLK